MWYIADSTAVQVDEKGEKVRSLVNSGMLILREIPEDTPPEVMKHSECGVCALRSNTLYSLFMSIELLVFDIEFRQLTLIKLSLTGENLA
jgi:hypothetical protein